MFTFTQHVLSLDFQNDSCDRLRMSEPVPIQIFSCGIAGHNVSRERIADIDQHTCIETGLRNFVEFYGQSVADECDLVEITGLTLPDGVPSKMCVAFSGCHGNPQVYDFTPTKYVAADVVEFVVHLYKSDLTSRYTNMFRLRVWTVAP